MTFLQILAGLGLLAYGGDLLVRGAVGVADKMGVSPLFTGLVLVGFGTSLPELVTSITAISNGSSAIVVGNVLGSNVANILLILGITATILAIPAEPKSFRRDGPMLALATVACMAFALSGEIDRYVGAIFVASLIAYLFYTYTTETQHPDASAALHEEEATLAEIPVTNSAVLWSLPFVGGAMVLLGAHWTVSGSITVARSFEIPETVIGLTIVALGTSLPELATSVTAAMKRQTDVALGNIIGSNLFNILGILGITALVQPITVPPGALTYDLWIFGAVSTLMFWFAFTDYQISRREGFIFVVFYAAYLVFLAFRAFG